MILTVEILRPLRSSMVFETEDSILVQRRQLRIEVVHNLRGKIFSDTHCGDCEATCHDKRAQWKGMRLTSIVQITGF